MQNLSMPIHLFELKLETVYSSPIPKYEQREKQNAFNLHDSSNPFVSKIVQLLQRRTCFHNTEEIAYDKCLRRR